MQLNKFLDVKPEVAEAIAAGKPVVALESTIISHGMPYPQNVQTALEVERIIRENGAVPATIAIIGGRLNKIAKARECYRKIVNSSNDIFYGNPEVAPDTFSAISILVILAAPLP